MNSIDLSTLVALWGDKNTDEVYIGIRLPYGATANQLVDMLQQFSRYGKVRAVALVHADELSVNKEWYNNLTIDSSLIVFNATQYQLLNIFDIIFCPESNVSLYSEIPPSVIKIGLPHGVDIPLQQTVETYGGGFCFDYILSAVQQEVLPKDIFFDKFPAVLRNHSMPFVCEIPFGFPKLDTFIKRVQESRGEKRAIIYHLSYLAIEEPWIDQIIKPTLISLLTNFPQYDVIFRPFHLDRNSTLVNEAIAAGQEFDNFIYSDADSYVDEYARGNVMVCHRAYKLHLYGLATGGMSVICTPERVSSTTFNKDQFLECSLLKLPRVVAAQIDKNQSISLSDIVNRCKKAGIYNPNDSIRFLMNNLKSIIENKQQPNWRMFALSNAQSVDICRYTIINLLTLKPGNIFFIAFIEQYPKWKFARLLAADSYSRAYQLHFYLYRQCLQLFFEFVNDGELTLYEKKSANKWWKATGANTLSFIQKESISLNKELTKAECWLSREYGDTSVKNIADDAGLFCLSSNSWEALTGSVILYGAGEVAQNFLTKNLGSPLFNIEAIVDSNPKLNGTFLEGIPVYSLDNYDSKLSPNSIIICSHAFVGEIYHRIESTFQSRVKIFAICPDSALRDLITLTINHCSQECSDIKTDLKEV